MRLDGRLFCLHVRKDGFRSLLLEQEVHPVGLAPYSDGFLLFFWLAAPQLRVVNSSQVTILKVYLLQVGGEDVDFASVRKYRLVIELFASQSSPFSRIHLDKGFPDLSLLKDQHPLNLAILREQLIKQVVGDDLS